MGNVVIFVELSITVYVYQNYAREKVILILPF